MGWSATFWRLTLDLLGRLQPDTADRFGAMVGGWAFHIGVRRRVTSDNLARCLGLQGTQRRAVALQSHRSMGANFLMLWVLDRIDARHWRLINTAQAFRAVEAADGCTAVTAHHGAWEVGGKIWAQYLDRGFYAYAKHQHNAGVDVLVTRQRERAGMSLLYADTGTRRDALQAMRHLRAGKVVGLLADQAPYPHEGTPAWFLGRPTWAHHGPISLAARLGKPLILTLTVRVGAGRYVYMLSTPLATTGRDPQRLLQRILDMQSALIARFPGQYFWQHRRFKHGEASIDYPAHPRWRRGLAQDGLIAETEEETA